MLEPQWCSVETIRNKSCLCFCQEVTEAGEGAEGGDASQEEAADAAQDSGDVGEQEAEADVCNLVRL